MARALRVFRVNTGSCGGCDILAAAAVRADPGLAWAESPHEADVLLLTGPATAAARPALLALLEELGGRVPVAAVGACAVDGQPYGRGGALEVPALKGRAMLLGGCPPSPDEIAAALRAAAEQHRAPRGG